MNKIMFLEVQQNNGRGTINSTNNAQIVHHKSPNPNNPCPQSIRHTEPDPISRNFNME